MPVQIEEKGSELKGRKNLLHAFPRNRRQATVWTLPRDPTRCQTTQNLKYSLHHILLAGKQRIRPARMQVGERRFVQYSGFRHAVGRRVGRDQFDEVNSSMNESSGWWVPG